MSDQDHGGTLEKAAAAMANHALTRTTQLYDRRRLRADLCDGILYTRRRIRPSPTRAVPRRAREMGSGTTAVRVVKVRKELPSVADASIFTGASANRKLVCPPAKLVMRPPNAIVVPSAAVKAANAAASSGISNTSEKFELTGTAMDPNSVPVPRAL
jgi:hypothetical protein